jgi:hypothetical protein
MKIIVTENQLKKIVLKEDILGIINRDDIKLNDIWYGLDKLRYGDMQSANNSPLKQVQKRLLNYNEELKEYGADIGFKADNDFGPSTAKMIGKLFGKTYKDLKSVSIGPLTLSKLGFKKPTNLSVDEFIVAITLAMEYSKESEVDIKAIANVIANRKAAGRGNVVDVVLDSSQFSGWNKFQPVTSNMKTIKKALRKDRYHNRDSWDLAIKYAKLLLSGANFPDNTEGATHYYNPTNPDVLKNPPEWGKESDTWIPHPPKGLKHIFGRDGKSNWSKKFKGR